MVSKNMFANDVERDDARMIEIMVITITMRIKTIEKNVRNMITNMMVSSNMLARTADSKKHTDNNEQ